MSVTHDALLDGRLRLAQPAEGYRVNVDAVWLAAFAADGAKPPRHVVDLGAGVGAVGLSLAAVGAPRVTLVELDPALAALARVNAAPFGAVVHEGDVRDLVAPNDLAATADLVVCNPPYFVEGQSRPAAARHARARLGEAGLLTAFVRAARRTLGAAGRACFVHPVGALPNLLEALSTAGLPPKRLRLVHPLPDRAASVALVEAKPARPGGLRVLPPLLAMTTGGAWSDEARALLAGGFSFRDTTSGRRRGSAPCTAPDSAPSPGR